MGSAASRGTDNGSVDGKLLYPITGVHVSYVGLNRFGRGDVSIATSTVAQL
jgi:hypothetical protein